MDNKELTKQEKKELMQKLLYLYQSQTDEEQNAGVTVEKNNAGFNGVDAGFCSSLAEQVLSGRYLSQKQFEHLGKILPKYSRQTADPSWWNAIVVPEPFVPAVRKIEKTTDKLDLDPITGGLMFTPVTYPSKQIQGISKFYWTDKAWLQSRKNVTASIVNAIQKMFPDTVVSDEVMQALAPKQVTLKQQIADNKVLFPFQKEAIQFLAANDHSLLSLAPGLGKTVCSVFAAEQVGAKRVLVISPLSLLYNWKNEIQKWLGETANVVYKQACPSEQELGRWTITNYDTVRLNSESFIRKWDCIIADETILLKNRRAIRTKTIKSLFQQVKPKFGWFLSGSPTSRLYDDMWAQLNILDSRTFSSYWKFAERYCHVEQTQWGWSIVANRATAAQDLKSDLADIFFARTQDQVLDLPEWIFDNVTIQMSEEQNRIYTEMEDRFVADLGDGQNLLAPNVLSQMTRLVQLASNPVLVGGASDSTKWQAVEELLEYEQLPAIVWTSFIRTANFLKEQLSQKYRVGVLTGETGSAERQETVDKFQNGELDVIIAHPGVGKFGFTLTAARTSIYLERSYNADDYYQSLHRVRRIGTTQSPHIIHLLSQKIGGDETIDHVIDRILLSRKENTLKLTEGELKEMFQPKRGEK